MLTIGLTGPTGAGKGAVANVCAAYGIPSIDTDRVYHELLIPPSPCLDQLVARFGADILTRDGQLDRRALAHRVFTLGNAQDHDDLNRITHRYVIERTEALCRDLEEAGCAAVLIDAPLLIEAGMDASCDKVLAVLASPDVRLSRIMARDALPPAAATERLRAQKPDEFYVSHATTTIYNDGTTDELRTRVADVLTSWGVRHA